MFNIYLAIFVIVALAIVVGGTMYVNNMGKGTAALLYGIGSMYLMVIYGVKWFGKTSPFTPPKGPWPATINTCPDFLTAYKRVMPNGMKQEVCIDTIGVSKNGALSVFPSGAAPTSDRYYFSLNTATSDPINKVGEWCTNALNAGLTWEGVTNGESCVSSDGSSTPPNTSGSGCPQTS
jgi:hypothetical protein